MRTRIIPLLCSILILAACDGSGLGLAESVSAESTTTQLSFELVDLEQQGGSQCPEEIANSTEATAEAEGELCATVKFRYPKINSEAKPELAEKLNAFILRQMVDNPVEGMAAENMTPEQFAEGFIQEYTEAPNPFSSWELDRSIRIVFTTKNMITLLFEEYGYTGGAHPYSGYRYSVLSLEDGRQIQLADLLNPAYEAALNVAGEKIFRETRKLKEEETLEEQGFAFPNDVFSLNDNFGVLKEGLDFIFNSYEIAPYALGPTQFTVPYEDIQELVSPEGELGQSAK
uniref:DUF3298 domain-containing protein n=1 Tax=uncultured Thiotrichaceae bacterium TaxID=298394 RepID=A0A6S6UIW9_9GAMM|nr:MAG: Unknown protein [uncultured Thiotrichaceae bacterium]